MSTSSIKEKPSIPPSEIQELNDFSEENKKDLDSLKKVFDELEVDMEKINSGITDGIK